MTTFLRIIKFALKNFWRNVALSIVTITIIVLVLFSTSFLFLLNILAQTAIGAVESKIDVSVYFTERVSEDKILDAKGAWEANPAVASIDYISKDQALEQFKLKHKDDDAIKALEQVGRNPFGAVLVLKAKSPDQYLALEQLTKDEKYKSVIMDTTFNDNRQDLEKLKVITTNIRRIGIGTSIVFAIIAILVIYSTIKMTIYNQSDEIGIMRLVGASNIFIRGPFIVESILYGLFASLIAMAILFFPLVGLVSPFVSKFFEGYAEDLFRSFVSNIWMVAMLQMVLGILLSIVSSAFAVRKYLKV
ncbi:hypothetical protein A2841_02050 [Candidatus Kaiserbacteria bacterium RIFCSPHIGHO2_01_FULL_48_10]|uniref:Cell division protein FtsX n=1 Tax=Candidatus Kaiserbacteria bacterium RIFCSPHIGHO2_01_FULL_48_10 TaxID=1798476 RepID=A0A1F6C6H0_9BACT|nr:MAG: hypothetical protein A2841_02050 [Candidatus Kaiserbacteria bacterium RIFCSPHIGHO2_01_FULL_48_10]HLD00041.1 permease-like cell division protein FtsX [Patescibacteria group bacterium]